MSWKQTYATAIAVLLAVSVIYYLMKAPQNLSSVVSASLIWGGLTLVLCLIFMLGAANSARQFLVFFGTGAFGAGMGYLVGAWLTPGGDSNPLDQMRNIVAGVLTGVVGTKLLTLWDDLVTKPATGGAPLILTGNFYIPIVLWLVGFTVSLSAFYTIRTSELGEVRVTCDPATRARRLGPKKVGVFAGDTVQFSGAASSSVDVSLDWLLRPADACSVYVEKPTDRSFHKTSFSLTAPKATEVSFWIKSCPKIRDFVLLATSVQDRAKYARFDVRFCSDDKDCPEVLQSETVPASDHVDSSTSTKQTGGTGPRTKPR